MERKAWQEDRQDLKRAFMLSRKKGTEHYKEVMATYRRERAERALVAEQEYKTRMSRKRQTLDVKE